MSETNLRTIVDTIPGMVCGLKAPGAFEYANRRVLQYFGETLEELKTFTISDVVHPEDLPRVMQAWKHSVEPCEPFEMEFRLRRADGAYCWFQSRALPAPDDEGRIAGWCMLLTDIDDRKRTESALRAREQELRLALDNIPGFVMTMTATGETELVNQPMLAYLGGTLEELKNRPQFLHPDDRARMTTYRKSAIEQGQPFEIEFRLRRADGVYRWFQGRGCPIRDPEGNIIRWYNLATDIDARKQAEEKLLHSESYLAEAQRLSRTGSFGWKVSTGNLLWSKETFSILEYPEDTKPTVELLFERVHPDDLALVQDAVERASRRRTDLDLEHRVLLPDGSIKHLHIVARAVKGPTGALEFIGALSDVTAAKMAEQELRRSEAECRQIIDAIPQLIAALGPDGRVLYANKTALEYSGLTAEEIAADDFRPRIFHAEDLERTKEQRQRGIGSGFSFDLEMRVRHQSGQYRWFLIHYKPVRDEQGCIVRWYATGTDIDDRKRAEDRIKNENLALREEIGRDAMFEDIVGSAQPLRNVLNQVAKVAPSDSTVLILGETGTGKELIARAIHKRSKRAAQVFIGVNCGAIPATLIASELFGHEKGAFTGAIQRRLGRFETANGGTIFLDEVGDLPPDIQIALLRVLQEREIERVGSGKPIPVDVRVLAATHRDLVKLANEGKFRLDLMYRLNVVPIHVPPLRERAADIPSLVEYFIARFERKAGKNFRTIDQKTLKLLQAYDWPGNIRELQNIVERSVILSNGDTFWIDEDWLSIEASPRTGSSSGPFTQTLQNHEKELIESALAESNGRIAGPTGAAAKLGIPRSTLDRKIQQLGIKRHSFTSEPN